MSQAPRDVSMRQFLEQVGREFGELSAEIERLQDTVSELLSGAAVEPRLLRQAQSLDHVFQHCAELAAIIRRAASETEPRWRLDTRPVLEGVSLSGLARRLAGDDNQRVEGGELEMF